VESSVQLDDQVHTQPPRAPNEASLEPHSIFGEPSARCQVHPDRTPISNPVVLHLASECDHRRHITVARGGHVSIVVQRRGSVALCEQMFVFLNAREDRKIKATCAIGSCTNSETIAQLQVDSH
jgi:hypothetical protein